MPDETLTATAPEPPADAGLPPSRPGTEPSGPRRTGDELITAAAKGETLSNEESVDLLEYFVANGELPGDDDPIPVEWEIGEGRNKRTNTWMVKRIGWDAWKESEARALDEATGVIDGYKLASWVVAHGLVKPQLGPRVRKMQETDPKTAPEHAADLLQRMFNKQGGTLAAISSEIRRISRLGNQESARTLDQEVAAGEA